VLAPVLALIVFLGVYPKPVLDRMAPSVKSIVQRVDERSGTHQPAGAAEGKQP
jgi:NADH-quinone oxidoreductase subunit M